MTREHDGRRAIDDADAMEDERQRLAASVERARAELEATLGELRGVVRERLDWRAWVRERPLVAVALAAALGFGMGRGGRR